MLQFERGAELGQLLAAGAIAPAELEAFGRQLVSIRAGLPKVAPTDPWGRPENVQAMILSNVDDCGEAAASFGLRPEVEALRAPLATRFSSLADCMAERRAGGWVRECHGDLHAGNIVRRGVRLVAFDCMEFEPAFPWIDVADEVAFLLSDMAARGCTLHAHAFLGGYLAQGGNYEAGSKARSRYTAIALGIVPVVCRQRLAMILTISMHQTEPLSVRYRSG